MIPASLYLKTVKPESERDTLDDDDDRANAEGTRSWMRAMVT